MMTGNGNPILSGNIVSATDGTDFADVAIGFPVNHTFTITNSGAEDLIINSVTVTGAYRVYNQLNSTNHCGRCFCKL